MSTTRKLLLLILCCFVFEHSFAQTEEIRDYWLDKYLSVCFPLRSIHVNSPFGYRKDPFSGHLSAHKGIDLQARYEEALSMFDGQVKATGRDNSNGNYVVMRYGNYTVTYCHLSRIYVKRGDLIFSGDPVGITGNTGSSTGPHLHITIRMKGELIDPYDILLYIRDTKRSAIAALGIDESKILTPDAFIKRYASYAMKAQRQYGIPSSVTLAQMALESERGNSDLARAGYNYFGIKANRSWLERGLPYSLKNDDRPNEKFCNFPSPEASIDYHSRLLMSDRYSHCRRYGPLDFHNWLVGIKRGGYATASNYVSRCEKIIRQHRLWRFDSAAERGEL